MTKPVHVLQVLPAFESGGVERATLDMARFLALSPGASVTCSVASQGGRLVQKVEQLGVSHYYIPLNTKNPFKIIRNAYRLAALIRRCQVTLVHVRSRAPAWSVWLASIITGIPFITTFHGAYKSNGFFKRFYNGVMTRGKAIIAISQYIVGHIRRAYPHVEDKLNLIYEGIDISGFSSSLFTPNECEKQRKVWGMMPGEKAVLLPARLAPGKGHLIAIEALYYLNNPFLKLIFVGASKGRKLKELLKKQVDFYGLKNQILWMETNDQMPLLYAASDFVLSVGTTPEAFGRVAVEAAAMGRLTIGTATGATPELIEAEKSGFLVPANNPKALADTLQRALNLSSHEKEALENRARQRCHHFFSLEQMGRETLALYLKTSL